MQFDSLSISLAPRELEALARSLPLPKGIRVDTLVMTDAGIEATIRASFLLGLPLKFRAEVEDFAGAKVLLRVSPPVKPNWLVVRPLVLAIPGATYAGNSVLEVDLVSASKGLLSALSVKKLAVNRSGLRAEVTGVSVNAGWEQVLGNMSR